MSFETILLLTAFAFASTWTPGPNNAMLASSGATFGFRPTTPHALGVALGFPLMAFCIAFGLGEAFQRSELLREGLRIVGVVALLWVAYKVATAKAPGTPGARTRPFTFLEAGAFQWVNPKAWVMAISTSALYVVPEETFQSALTISGIFVVSGLTSAFGWAGFGALLQRWLRHPMSLRIFNVTMALLILSSVIVLLTADLA